MDVIFSVSRSAAQWSIFLLLEVTHVLLLQSYEVIYEVGSKVHIFKALVIYAKQTVLGTEDLNNLLIYVAESFGSPEKHVL